MKNTDIRNEIKAAGLKFWEVAHALGIKSDGNFSRKLRIELSADEKAKIRAAIEQLKEKKRQEGDNV